MDIFVEEWGHGPRAVLVHGAMSPGAATWKRQRPLADRWTLVLPSRRGFAPNPPDGISDYEVDAGDIAELLGDGAHLVGHSSGGLVALLAAARRPDAVRSLCLLEPATFALVRGDPDLEAGFEEHKHRIRTLTDPREFLVAFMGALGAPASSVPDPLTPEMDRHVRLLMNERPPHDASIPVDVLAAAPWPKLVVSGQHDKVQDLASHAAAAAIGAAQAVLPGAGHLIPRADGCNELLERLWAESAGPTENINSE